VTRLTLLVITPRSTTFEIENGEPFASATEHVVALDGTIVSRSRENVFRLNGLRQAEKHVVTVETTGVQLKHEFRTAREVTFINVKRSAGSPRGDDTEAVQNAINSCPEGGTIIFPSGDWHCAPIFLKSHVDLYLPAHARLIGHPDVLRWPVLPAIATSGPQRGQVLGTWEGEPADCHAALLNGIGIENVRIYGEGTIDGNASFGTWWSRPKTPFLGWRPRLIYLVRSKSVTIDGLTLRNSPSWTIHPFQSRDLMFASLSIEAPANSPNTDGINPDSCENVRIAGVRFATGDDCVAIKSGKIAMARRGLIPSRNIKVSNCLMEEGHGGVVIGSEVSGGIYDVEVHDCIFRGTDRGLRLKTRRGRGKSAIIDGIRLENVRMEGVGTPFVINSFYWCDPDGKEAWIGDRHHRPVDDLTPAIRNISLRNVTCENVQHSAGFLLGLPEQPIENITLENYQVRFDPNANPGEPDMAEGITPVAREGFRASNVRGLKMTNVDIKGADGPVLIEENVS
jgi:polygalacturonase